MTLYTVTYTRDALQAMARLWLGAFDRHAVTQAGDAVENVLREDAPRKGLSVGSTLRQVIVAPIVSNSPSKKTIAESRFGPRGTSEN